MPPKKKSPGRALLLSALVFPGAGQVYNGDRLKGYVLIALGLILSLLLILKGVMVYTSYLGALLASNPAAPPGKIFAQEIPTFLFLLGALFILWVYGMVDAYWVGKG